MSSEHFMYSGWRAFVHELLDSNSLGFMNMHIELSLAHVHCHGLHSLVFTAGPPMVRLYYAEIDHELWRNSVTLMANDDPRLDDELSIAIHSHRQDITLVPIFGTVVNHAFKRVADDDDYTPRQIEIDAYRYVSPILHSRGEFVPCRWHQLAHKETTTLCEPLELHAKALHTVYVPPGTRAAWLVVEGQKDAEYDDTCYSNADLAHFDWAGLYQPMTRSLARMIINDCSGQWGCKQ
jgi:hypothetical protein